MVSLDQDLHVKYGVVRSGFTQANYKANYKSA